MGLVSSVRTGNRHEGIGFLIQRDKGSELVMVPNILTSRWPCRWSAVDPGHESQKIMKRKANASQNHDATKNNPTISYLFDQRVF